MSAVLFALAACTGEGPPPPAPSPAPAPPAPLGDAVASYVVSFPSPATHRVEVELTTRCAGDGVVLWMPVWTPGSYLVREFSRHVEGVTGGDGVEKLAKNRWRVRCAGDAPVVVRYRVNAQILSVRESYVDDRLGVLNGAATFLFPDGTTGPYDVRLALPEGWTGAATPLPPHPDGGALAYRADLDTVIDAPIVLGTPIERPFEVAGVPHRLVTVGEPGPWDADRAAREVETVAEEVAAFWGGPLPYRSYDFLAVLAQERGGGLEHLDGTLLVVSRWSQARPDDRASLLSLVAHEHFHAWNVKRLRPEGLGPFDYEREVYTPLLWVAEGVTSYYDDLLVARAGLVDEDAYLARMSDNVEDVQGTPGRLVEPVSEASLDAWTEHYRPDDDSTNRSVDYYTKGAVVGWLLDAEVRRATDDRASLDDVMRRLYALGRPIRPEDVRAVAAEVAGRDLGPFFDRYVDGTEELDYGPALQWWGLAWKEPPDPPDGAPVPGWLGLSTATRDGKLVVTEVKRGTPAWDAGLSPSDELLAIDGFRLAGDLDARLAQLGEARAIELLLARRGVVRTLPVTLGRAPDRTWELEVDPGASPQAARRRAAWLAHQP